MKILYIFLLLVFVSCNNRERKNRISSDFAENDVKNIITMDLDDNPNNIFGETEQSENEIYQGIMTHYVTVNLRLRDGASLSSTIVTTLPQNTAIRIIEKGSTETIDGIIAPWIKVISETGYVGWCFSGYVRQLELIPKTNYNFPLSIEFNTRNIYIARSIDSDMRSNVNIIRFPESCRIMNLDEIENSKIDVIFNQPILNKNILFPPEFSENPYFDNIVDLLRMFEIDLSEAYIEKFNSSAEWVTTRIEMENINLFTYRTIGQSQKLFIIEYNNNCSFYDFNIKIGTSKNQIIERFGEPTFYSKDREIFIYSSFRTLRQINIFFRNAEVIKVQIISWGGV